MPQMLDPNFSKALLYICEHNEEGAMGIMVNRPIKLDLNEILEQLDFETSSNSHPIYWGGPVQEDRGFIIHSSPAQPTLDQPKESWESSLLISEGVRLTTSKDIIKAIAEDDGPERFVIALGYAGWGEGQLEQELAENIWLSCPANLDILFDSNSANKRQRAINSLGITEHQLNAQIGHA